MATASKMAPKVVEKAKSIPQPWEGHLGTKKAMVRHISPEEVMVHLGLVGIVEYPDYHTIVNKRSMGRSSEVVKTLADAMLYALSQDESFVLDVVDGKKVVAYDGEGCYWTDAKWVDSGLMDPNRINRKPAPTPCLHVMDTTTDMLVPVTKAELDDMCVASEIFASIPIDFIEQEYVLDARIHGKYKNIREAVEQYSIVRAKDGNGCYWTLAYHVDLGVNDPWRILNRHPAPEKVEFPETLEMNVLDVLTQFEDAPKDETEHLLSSPANAAALEKSMAQVITGESVVLTLSELNAKLAAKGVEFKPFCQCGNPADCECVQEAEQAAIAAGHSALKVAIPASVYEALQKKCTCGIPNDCICTR